jgi:hypothetical protein
MACEVPRFVEDEWEITVLGEIRQIPPRAPAACGRTPTQSHQDPFRSAGTVASEDRRDGPERHPVVRMVGCGDA